MTEFEGQILADIAEIKATLKGLKESHDILTNKGTISCQYREPQTDIGKMVAGLTAGLMVIGGLIYAAYEVIRQHGK